MAKRENFKVWHTYKGVLCQYLDGVNYNFDKHLSLGATLERCRKKHPNCFVWYEVINIHPYNAPNGKIYRNCRCLCDIRVIYSQEKIKPVLTMRNEEEEDAVRLGKYTAKKLTDSDKYAIENTEFVGTLDECTKWYKYVRQAPECYKSRAMKCVNIDDLTMRTDFGGKCVLTKYTSQKNYKSDLNFRYTMHKGNAYLLY